MFKFALLLSLVCIFTYADPVIIAVGNFYGVVGCRDQTINLGGKNNGLKKQLIQELGWKDGRMYVGGVSDLAKIVTSAGGKPDFAAGAQEFIDGFSTNTYIRQYWPHAVVVLAQMMARGELIVGVKSRDFKSRIPAFGAMALQNGKTLLFLDNDFSKPPSVFGMGFFGNFGMAAGQRLYEEWAVINFARRRGAQPVDTLFDERVAPSTFDSRGRRPVFMDLDDKDHEFYLIFSRLYGDALGYEYLVRANPTEANRIGEDFRADSRRFVNQLGLGRAMRIPDDQLVTWPRTIYSQMFDSWQTVPGNADLLRAHGLQPTGG